MREIKFRAWDREKGMSWSPDLTDYEQAEAWFRILEDTYYEGSPVLMQYTGLKDKNGKEIYEGDILSWTSEHELGTLTHQREVVFVEGFFGMDSVIGCQSLNKYPQDIKVIGNIYENPDLLTPPDTNPDYAPMRTPTRP